MVSSSRHVSSYRELQSWGGPITPFLTILTTTLWAKPVKLLKDVKLLIWEMAYNKCRSHLLQQENLQLQILPLLISFRLRKLSPVRRRFIFVAAWNGSTLSAYEQSSQHTACSVRTSHGLDQSNLEIEQYILYRNLWALAHHSSSTCSSITVWLKDFVM